MTLTRYAGPSWHRRYRNSEPLAQHIEGPPLRTAALSLVLPGAGPLYSRHYRAALLFVLGAALLHFSRGLPAGTRLDAPMVINLMAAVVLGIALLLAAAADSFMASRRSRRALRRMHWLNATWTIGGGLLILLGLALMLDAPKPRLHSFRINGRSMQPTLHAGDLVLAETGAEALLNLRRGDIVVFYPPGAHRWSFIKRIVGLPGQTVQMVHGHLMVDGAEITAQAIGAGPLRGELRQMSAPDGSYWTALKFAGSSPQDDTPAVHLRGDEYFVVGDNMDDSLDSRARAIGPIHRTQLLGRAAVVLWAPEPSRVMHTVR